MKISSIELIDVQAGWRVWSFLRINTNEGIHGISEFSESNGSRLAISAAINEMKEQIIDCDPRNYNFLINNLRSKTVQSAGGIITKAISAIENALIDIVAKKLNIPVYELFGGKIRNNLTTYWSHCGTSRVRAANHIQKNPISKEEDLIEFCKEVNASGFKYIKTNLGIRVDGEKYSIYMPGSNKSKGWPELEYNIEIENEIVNWIGKLHHHLDKSIQIAVDLNFNFRQDGIKQLLKKLEKFNLLWIELDYQNLQKIGHLIRTTTPICSGENNLTPELTKILLSTGFVDILSIDVNWNGFTNSIFQAKMAETDNLSITPHNFNSHISTFIAAQFGSIIPNMKLMEYDVDDVPWRDIIVTEVPKFKDGDMILQEGIGWGIDLDYRKVANYRIRS